MFPVQARKEPSNQCPVPLLDLLQRDPGASPVAAALSQLPGSRVSRRRWMVARQCASCTSFSPFLEPKV